MSMKLKPTPQVLRMPHDLVTLILSLGLCDKQIQPNFWVGYLHVVSLDTKMVSAISFYMNPARTSKTNFYEVVEI